MFTFTKFDKRRVDQIFATLKERSNINQIKELQENAEANVKHMLGMDSYPSICETVIFTETAFGLTDMRCKTKFASAEVRNATKLVCGIIKTNPPPIQKEVVTYLTAVYSTALDMGSKGMGDITSFSDLINYRRLFIYYTNKIDFMLNQWGEMFHTMKMNDKHEKFQTQKRRIEKMEMNHLAACALPIGFVVYPCIIVANLTICCWAPCFVACKIATIDDAVEEERRHRANDKENFW